MLRIYLTECDNDSVTDLGFKSRVCISRNETHLEFFLVPEFGNGRKEIRKEKGVSTQFQVVANKEKKKKEDQKRNNSNECLFPPETQYLPNPFFFTDDFAVF